MSDINPYAAPAYDPAPATADLLPILQGVQFPLRMTFKILTFAPTVTITDATGRVVLVVRQKFFKLKEHVQNLWRRGAQSPGGRNPGRPDYRLVG